MLTQPHKSIMRGMGQQLNCVTCEPKQAQRRLPGSGRKPRSRAGEKRQRPSADSARRRESERLEQRLKRLHDEQEALPRLVALTQGAMPACPHALLTCSRMMQGESKG
jgi:hypothetical protein